MNQNIPREWLLELVKTINKSGRKKWQSSFCQKCGEDLKNVVYGEFCECCTRDEKLKDNNK